MSRKKSNLKEYSIEEICLQIKKRIHKQIPNAKIKMDINGTFYIDDKGKNLFSEYYVPHTQTVFSAWTTIDQLVHIVSILNRPRTIKYDAYSTCND